MDNWVAALSLIGAFGSWLIVHRERGSRASRLKARFDLLAAAKGAGDDRAVRALLKLTGPAAEAYEAYDNPANKNIGWWIRRIALRLVAGGLIAAGLSGTVFGFAAFVRSIGQWSASAEGSGNFWADLVSVGLTFILIFGGIAALIGAQALLISWTPKFPQPQHGKSPQEATEEAQVESSRTPVDVEVDAPATRPLRRLAIVAMLSVGPVLIALTGRGSSRKVRRREP